MLNKGDVIRFDVLGERHYGVVDRLEQRDGEEHNRVYFEDEDGSIHFLMEKDVTSMKGQNVLIEEAWWL